MNKIWSDELREKGRYHVCEQDDGFGDVGTNEVERGGEDDDIGHIVNEACMIIRALKVSE